LEDGAGLIGHELGVETFQEADTHLVRGEVDVVADIHTHRAALAQIQSATTHELVGWLDTLVAYNRVRVSEGVTAEADLIRSEVERDRLASEAAMQDAELAQARAALGAYVSDDRESRQLPSAIVDDMPLPAPRTSQSFSIDARPDVRAARERVAASNAAVTGERSMVLRQLGATIGTMQTGHTTSMIAGISLPLPLFDLNHGEIQRARAERDGASFELAARERTATADIRGANAAACPGAARFSGGCAPRV
jgi:cobalt-zinc-cadmium efflux system outer membrane protein